MSADGEFSATVELLVALADASHSHPPENDVDDWLKLVSSKIKLQSEQNNDPRKVKVDKKTHKDNVDYGNQIDCSFAHSAVKSRLGALMGSNIVRLTDRKYMLTLVEKIREDHENKQAARVEERKRRELMRTKTMILNRFMTIEEAQPEILQYPLFQLYSYCDSLSHPPRKKRPKKVKISGSLYRLLYPERFTADIQTADNLSLMGGSEEGEEEGEYLSDGELDEKNRKKNAVEKKDPYMFTWEEYDSLHYQADAVKKLKDIKTVNAMYANAHDIVGFLYSLSNKKPKTCARDEEPKEP